MKFILKPNVSDHDLGTQIVVPSSTKFQRGKSFMKFVFKNSNRIKKVINQDIF